MIVSISAVLLLGVLVLLLCRHANLRAWHALVCALFGFYLASSSIGPHIANALRALAHAISQIHI